MSSPIEALFCDLDRTLLTSCGKFPEESWEMLDELAQRRIAFIPCTGRSLHIVPERLREHEAVPFAICASGSTVFDLSTGEAVWSRPVGVERALALYAEVQALDTTFDVFADGKIFESRRRYERMGAYGIDAVHIHLMSASRIPLDLPTPKIITGVELLERLGIFWPVSAAGERDAEKIKREAEAIEGLRVTQSHPQGYEIVDERASKGDALTWLCEHCAIDPARTLAFGDSENDLEMLERAGRGVAVANAGDALRAAADDVCGSCDEAGVPRYVMDLLG